MDNTTVYIPNNYTDAGKIFGMFEVRNTAEALILCIPLVLLTIIVSPFGLTGTLITTIVLIVSVGGFALIGIHDYSLITFIRLHHRWRKNRRIIIYRGSQWLNTKKTSIQTNARAKKSVR